MTAIELIQALRQMSVETGSLVCLDCEHEHKCGIHGCAIMRTAADLLDQLTAEPPNDPLTLEELRGMDGELVKAQDEGRMVLLPCEVGDTLYSESPIRGMVTSFKAPDLAWIIENISEFGKTVLLTRAEAEAAIGGGGDG